MNYGKCKIFQTDNGTEFKNAELKTFLANEGIKQIFSRVYHPQSNGAVEAVHKDVRKYLITEYNKKKKKFNIEISLEEFIIYHNNNIHSSTKRKPIDIKDLDDLDEIDEINMNIIKSMSRKIKDEINIKEDDLLLLTDNIIVNKNNIKIRYKNGKNNYVIPCRFKSFKNNSLVTIIIDIDYKNILNRGKEYLCDHNLLNIVEEFAYNFYKKQYNNENIQ
jgi:hypothetical protein